MAVKLTATGATVTTGKGAAKTVVLEVDFTELRAWAKRTKVEEAKVWRKAYGSALRGLKAKFKKVVSRAGGVEGVPKFKDFEQFTKELRTAYDRTRPMGGVLADKKCIVSYKLNGWQYIGWPDALAKWAVKFQDGAGGSEADDFLNSPKSRHYLHSRGLKEIPHVYAHNPRRVLPEPFVSYVDKHLETWAEHVFMKELAKLMAKGAA